MKTECQHESIVDDEQDVICRDCGEHSGTESCEECGDNFGTACCGARGR